MLIQPIPTTTKALCYAAQKMGRRLRIALLSLRVVGCTPPDTDPLLQRLDGPSPQSAYGCSLATGDLNGDGVPDLIVGGDDQSEAWVYLGGEGLYPEQADWVLPASERGSQGQQFWPGLTTGDVNGDGYDDILVDGDLYLGGTEAPTEDAWVARELPSSALLMDANQDGYADLVATHEVGAIALYPGGPEGLGARALGWSTPYAPRVQPAGDVNGDGYPDLLVTSETWDDTVRVVPGGPGGLDLDGTWALSGDAADLRAYGLPAVGAGDLDGDGTDDLVLAGRRGWRPYDCLLEVVLGGPEGPGAPLLETPVPTHVCAYGGLASVGALEGGSRDAVMWTVAGSRSDVVAMRAFTLAASEDALSTLFHLQIDAVGMDVGLTGRYPAPAVPLPDLDADGFPEFAVSVDGNPSFDTTGGVWIYSGRLVQQDD